MLKPNRFNLLRQQTNICVAIISDPSSCVVPHAGPGCDTVCLPAGLLASRWGIPMISYGCVSEQLSNKLVYSTFARTHASYADVGLIVGAMMARYGWQRVNVIASWKQLWEKTSSQIQVCVCGWWLGYTCMRAFVRVCMRAFVRLCVCAYVRVYNTEFRTLD